MSLNKMNQSNEMSFKCYETNHSSAEKSDMNPKDIACSDRIRIDGIPDGYSQRLLYKLFQPFATKGIPKAFIFESKKLNMKWGVIQYRSCFDAFTAMKAINGTVVEDNQLYVHFDHPMHNQSECDIRSKLMARMEDQKRDNFPDIFGHKSDENIESHVRQNTEESVSYQTDIKIKVETNSFGESSASNLIDIDNNDSIVCSNQIYEDIDPNNISSFSENHKTSEKKMENWFENNEMKGELESIEKQELKPEIKNIIENEVKTEELIKIMNTIDMITKSIPESKISSDNNKSLVSNRKSLETTIENLDQTVLSYVLSYLSLKDKFIATPVSHKWKDVCHQLLKEERVISFGKTESNEHLCENHYSSDLTDASQAIITPNNILYLNDKSVNNLTAIFRRTENIESLNFSNCAINTIELKWVFTQLPKLHCLTFDSITGIGLRDWPKIGRSLAKKITHFTHGGDNLWSQSLSQMVDDFELLERLTIFKSSQRLQTIFKNMKPSVTHLKIYDCKRLDSSSIKHLTEKRGLHLQSLVMDLNGVIHIDDIIASVDAIIFRINSFDFFNITHSELNRLTYDKDFESVTVIFNDFIDLTLIGHNVRNKLRNLSITGNVKPSDVEHIVDLVPECQQIKLIDCYFYCQCLKSDKFESNRFYQCFECYDKAFSAIAELPQLSSVIINDQNYS